MLVLVVSNYLEVQAGLVEGIVKAGLGAAGEYWYHFSIFCQKFKWKNVKNQIRLYDLLYEFFIIAGWYFKLLKSGS